MAQGGAVFHQGDVVEVGCPGAAFIIQAACRKQPPCAALSLPIPIRLVAFVAQHECVLCGQAAGGLFFVRDFNPILKHKTMNQKIGRNDPCPCGSGKKYKQCCGKPAAPAAPTAESHEGAGERAVAWLAQHHRKAFAVALQDAMEEAVFENFDDEDEAREALASINEELWQNLQINLTEWLLAEGDILVKGERQRVAELLLGPRGPLLTTGQRAWLEQLARRPLRLYDVTEVTPGVGVTVCDALDTDQPPLVVAERAGSRSMNAGMQIGARVMEVGGRHQFSGAIYLFSAWGGRAVQATLRDLAAAPSAHAEDDISSAGLIIIEGWLAQFLVPEPLPDIIDHHSGDPLLFTTDHYAVQDWDELAAALATQPDVQGDRQDGWDRLLDCDDGQTRSQASINVEAGGQRVGVFYKTAVLAEQGRDWFDALAGKSVKFQLREVSDPKGVMSRARVQAPHAQVKTSSAMPAGIDAETMAEALETFIKRNYANWADEPIPALQGRTPRQAIQSVAGMERVKGLLRSYEDGEAQQASQQGRREISYQFLWDALGLRR